MSEITRQRALLAEDDPVLQALLEALPDAHPCRLLDPEAELLLLVRVIFLGDLKHRGRHIYSFDPAPVTYVPSAQQAEAISARSRASSAAVESEMN